ncbi:carbohydrate esterase family 16 protein [Baudoinia panamericana UAMH 10762]|uniref:Carbohydrate esterase family 16 protein n=1 Tax=Baudoinia panamericana (strain UAMH 10762) TaxID=717646 RepID=M2LX06_BAUPA|nr:carbohydrate esterase family 16 protein [Baudoinia panamericana UAMH 10762]EMC99217.1 carbohydrate esterase family 16 protein [Baudoinia panamericana UAMH 10762]
MGDSDMYNVSFPVFYDELVTTMFQSVEQIYDLGYSEFLVMKLPPLDRTPPNLSRAAGPLPNATMVEWYGDALARHAVAFEQSHEGSEVMVFETTTFLNYVLDNPAEYGITNTTGYCAAYDQPDIDTDPGMYGCLPLDQYL